MFFSTVDVREICPMSVEVPQEDNAHGLWEYALGLEKGELHSQHTYKFIN